MPAPAPFEIVEAGDAMVASNGAATMQIKVAEGGRLFRRRAVRVNKALETRAEIEWAVAELDGVRAYFDGANVVLTRADLQP